MKKYIKPAGYMMMVAVLAFAAAGVLIIRRFNREAKAGKALHESEPEV